MVCYHTRYKKYCIYEPKTEKQQKNMRVILKIYFAARGQINNSTASSIVWYGCNNK